MNLSLAKKRSGAHHASMALHDVKKGGGKSHRSPPTKEVLLGRGGISRLRPHERKMLDLFPDPALPDQILRPGAWAEAQGERKLMAAVLLDAVQCYAKGIDAADRSMQNLFRKTSRWFFRDDYDHIYSFRNICLTLDLDPQTFREVLREIRRDRRKRVEIKRRLFHTADQMGDDGRESAGLEAELN